MSNRNKIVSMAVIKCKNWLASPPLLVDAVIATVGSIAMCFIVDAFVSGIFSVFPGHPPVKINSKTTLEFARDIAVIAGFLSGIECVVKRIRGKEDILSSMVSGFRTGVIFGMFAHESAWVVIGHGIVYAPMEIGMSKVIEKSKFFAVTGGWRLITKAGDGVSLIQK